MGQILKGLRNTLFSLLFTVKNTYKYRKLLQMVCIDNVKYIMQISYKEEIIYLADSQCSQFALKGAQHWCHEIITDSKCQIEP